MAPKIALSFFIFLFSFFISFAQDAPITLVDKEHKIEAEGKEVMYKKEASGSVILHSNGWGINFRRGKHLTGYKKRMFEIDLVSMKHPKEYKSVNPYTEKGSSYIYGKLNSFAILRTGMGIQKVMYSKNNVGGGVEVRYLLFGGASIGFTKPIYLEVLHKANNIPNDNQYTIATEKYDPTQHYPDNIYGKASFTKGFDELKPHLGIYGKFGFSFEYGSRLDNIKAIETGVVVDGYLKKIPIMALTSNNNYFISLYISLHFGSKWN